jgi:hypothetical protein
MNKQEILLTFEDAFEGLVQLGEGVILAIHMGNKQEALQLLLNLMESTNSIRDSMEVMIDQVSMKVDSIFKSIVEAYEKEDYLMIVDLLEYEMVPIIHETRVQLLSLQEE